MADIDSEIFLNLINEVTDVANNMTKGNYFNAGFMLSFHQQHLVDLHKLCEKLKDEGKPETQLQKQVRLAKKMSLTDPFFEKRKFIRQDQESHKCCLGEFTCHYLGDVLTLTFQEEGRDSVHTLVKMCPFCGHSPNEIKPEKKPMNDDLWHLGNEVVRLRQSLDKNECAPGSVMAPESMIRKFNKDLKDILELINKIRMISGNISIKEVE